MSHSRRLRSVSRGFTLMELLAVLAVLAVLGGLAIRDTLEKRTQAARASLIEDYGTDLATMDRAVRAFIGTNGALFTAGTARVITLAELQTANLLPSTWANRSTGVGTSPLGQTYRIVGLKDATDGKIRAVIYENSAAAVLRLQTMGYDTSAGAPMTLKRDVGANLLSRKVVAGTLAAGSATATGAGSNGWTKSLATYVGTAPAQASAAVLVGFPDLEPSGSSGGPGSGLDLGRCAPRSPSCGGPSAICSNAAQQVAATCPAGRTIQGRWPHCIASGADTFYPVAQNSAVITLGRSDRTTRAFSDGECHTYAWQKSGFSDPTNPNHESYFHDCETRITTWRYTDVILNNGVQQRNWCEYQSYFFNGSGSSMQILMTSPVWAQNAPTTDDIFCCE